MSAAKNRDIEQKTNLFIFIYFFFPMANFTTVNL